MLIIVFELVVALKISLQGFVSLGLKEKLTEMTLDFILFAAISLLCQSLWITSISLLMPWRPDGQRAGSTINLPAEYFIMLPLALQFVVQVTITYKRVQDFLLLPDQPPVARLTAAGGH